LIESILRAKAAALPKHCSWNVDQHGKRRVRAHEAIDLFVFRAAREIGALTASLGGLDGLVFTAGIGEHAPEIRSRICARCAWLGVALDEHANDAAGPRIRAQASRVHVYVIPTDEERMIAEHTVKHIGQAAPLN
jgi:acetate kinase